MQSDIKNKNGRMYPKEILQREVARYNREFINKKSFLTNSDPDVTNVNLERVSHMIRISIQKAIILSAKQES